MSERGLGTASVTARNFLEIKMTLFCLRTIHAVKKTQFYFSFSDSIAFLLSLTLARKAGPRTAMTTLAHIG